MVQENSHLTMRGLPLDDRPYEKLASYGPNSLSDAELLAVIIRSGSRQDTALSLCQRLLASGREGQGLSFIQDSSLEELMILPGIGQVKAIQMKAALEIGRRASIGPVYSGRPQVRTPQDAICLLESEMRHLPREEMRIIMLDVRNRVIRISRIAEGGLSNSVIYPRDLFREAIKANAAGLIIAHNHPSGDAAPSREDMETTRRLAEAGEMMGVKVVDHIILATGGSISFKQSGLI